MAILDPEERVALEDSVRGLLDQRSSSSDVRALFEEGGEFDRDLWHEMAELGWTALLVPEQYGGIEAGMSAAAVVLKELGAHTTPTPYLSSSILATAALCCAGADAANERWLPRLASGEAIGAVALTGTGGRVDPTSFDVVASRTSSGGYKLDGTAGFVLDGALADVVVVGANDADTGATLLLAVEHDLPGLSIERLPSIDRTRAPCHLHFEGVSAAADSLLAEGEAARSVIERLIDYAAIALAADGLGAATRALNMSVDYAKERVQFGRPIGSFQAIKHKLADMYVLAKGSEAAVEIAAETLDREPGEARRQAATAGSFCRAAASRITGDAVQTHGGIGYTWEHDCHLLLKRAKFDEIYLTDLWSQRERLVDVIASRRGISGSGAETESLEGRPLVRDTPELAAFRQEVRAWAEPNSPGDWQKQVRDRGQEGFDELVKEYRLKLRKAGYLAPHWPKEFGGGGFSAAQQLVLKQELARANFPPVQGGIGMHHAAATIMMHGTPEQKKALDAILDGQRWCQGFSEPNAGSDLASLQTRAVRDGDDYIVNGQKIWSSGAHMASWCLLLARTDPEAPKHRGISVFMVELNSPGIEIRPIREATGGLAFSEIFFNDVRVPVSQRIGTENDGWRISQTTLSTERGSMMLDNHRHLVSSLNEIVAEAAQTPVGAGRVAAEHDGIRQEIGERAGETEVLGMLAERVIGQLFRHGEMGPEGSILKLFYSETLQKLTGLAARIRGVSANIDGGAQRLYRTSGPRSWLMEHIGSWTWTISAGSNEIQRNIISERILGLPRDPLTVEASRSKRTD